MDKLNTIYFFVIIFLVLLFSANYAQSDSSLIFLSVNVTSSDTISPYITYLSPLNNAVDGDGNFYFNCSAYDNTNISNISFYFDGALNQTIESIGGNDYDAEFSVLGLEAGIYTWLCNVSDSAGNSNISETRNVIYNESLVPLSYRFSGSTTNWSAIPDLRYVCNGTAVLDDPTTDKIRWNNCVNVTAQDFDSYVNFEYNNVTVLFGLDSNLNSSATITIRNLPWDATPLILRDGIICQEPECSNVTYSSGTAIFNVTHFSSYTTAGNSQIRIWDETDTGMPYADQTKYKDEDVKFFSNYTRWPTGAPITGATCSINFTDLNTTMTYNSTTLIYEYTRQFTNNGTFNWNVTCSAPGYNTLRTNDTVIILADTTAPSFNESNTKPQPNSQYNQTNIIPISVNPSENSTVTANISWDSTSQLINLIYNGTNWFYNSTFSNTLYPGLYNVTINATDRYNNSNITTTNFTVNDITAPSVTNINPNGANYIENATVNITANVTDSYYNNLANVFANITWDSTYETIALTYNSTSDLYEGTFDNTSEIGRYNITIIATDNANNVNRTEKSYFMILATPNSNPWIVLNSPDDNANIYDNFTVEFNYTVYDNEQTSLTCDLYIENTLENTTTAINATSNLIIYDFSAYGSYLWNVTCTDSVLSNYSETRTINLINTSNPSPAVVLNSPANEANFANGTSSVRLNWTSSDNNASVTDKVYVDNSTGFVQVYSFGHSPGNYIYNLATSDNTTYYWYVNSSDGNSTTQSEVRNFTINATIPANIPPSIILNYPANLTINDNLTVEFNYTATDAEQTTLNCTLFADNIGINNTIANNNTLVIFSYTFADYGVVYWNVTCDDNQSEYNLGYSETAWINLNNTNITDNETPIINLVSPIDNYNFTANNITLIFNVSDNSNTIQNCSLILNDTLNATQNTLTNGTYNFTLSNLANGDYNWSVECYDFSANYNISEIRNFTISAALIVCGNNIQEAGEDCDGLDLAGEDCDSLGYRSGALTCTASCTFNRTQCVSGGSHGCTEDWECTAWTNCIDGKQTRVCSDDNECGTIKYKPETARTCTCNEDWRCTDWTSCYNNTQTRTCYDANKCGTNEKKPLTKAVCYCDEDWKCSEWSNCEDEVQSRECVDASNCGTEKVKPDSYKNCFACDESWRCTNWTNCRDGYTTRGCYDLNSCNSSELKPTEYMKCPAEESPLNVIGSMLWWAMIILLSGFLILFAAKKRKHIVTVKNGVSIDFSRKSKNKKNLFMEHIARKIKSQSLQLSNYSSHSQKITSSKPLPTLKPKEEHEKPSEIVKEAIHTIEDDIKKLQRAGFAVKGVFKHKKEAAGISQFKSQQEFKKEIIKDRPKQHEIKPEYKPAETKKSAVKGFKTREEISKELSGKGFKTITPEIDIAKKLHSVMFKHTKGKMHKIRKAEKPREFTEKKYVEIKKLAEQDKTRADEQKQTNDIPIGKKVEVPKNRKDVLKGLKEIYNLEGQRR